MSHCRYLIMAGGTGGHIFPALAVAKELSNQGAEVVWLGTAQGMEASLVPKEDIVLKTIAIKGFRGKRWLSKLAVPFLLCRAVIQAMRIIQDVKPSVVVGFGGFVAAPGGIAARLLGKKLLIHEQNSVAGTTNKMLAKIANKTLEAFPNSLPDAVHVGNPVRSNILSLHGQNKKTHSDQINVLIVGGSLGAKAINDIVPFAFADMQKQHFNVWHQTGKNKIKDVLENYRQLGVNAQVDEFISDMHQAYLWADIVICRAGALTVSEVAVAEVPAVFIPLPSAIDNHQYHNALWLANNEAAIVIEQKELTKESLVNTLAELHANKEKLQLMRAKLHNLALPNAANEAANHCLALCEGKEYAIQR